MITPKTPLAAKDFDKWLSKTYDHRFAAPETPRQYPLKYLRTKTPSNTAKTNSGKCSKRSVSGDGSLK